MKQLTKNPKHDCHLAAPSLLQWLVVADGILFGSQSSISWFYFETLVVTMVTLPYQLPISIENEQYMDFPPNFSLPSSFQLLINLEIVK